MPSSPLSPAQIDAFKTDGHLILPDVIDADLLATWRDQFWNYVGCRPDEPESWPDQTGGFKPDPLFGDLPQTRAAQLWLPRTLLALWMARELSS